MKKEVKNCIKYYLENINSDGYKDYEIKRNIQSKEVVREYIEKEKPQWIGRTDFYEGSAVTNVLICDVLSNDGVSKLLKKIYSLPCKKFLLNFISNFRLSA